MDFLVWNEALSVGVPEIDADHRRIIDLVNKLHEGLTGLDPGAVVSDSLAALVDYTEYHFSREERAMEHCTYPARQEHMVSHRRFEEDLRCFQDDYNRAFPEGEGAKEVGERLLAYLKAWLVGHIIHADGALRPYIASVDDAGRAMNEVEDIKFS